MFSGDHASSPVIQLRRKIVDEWLKQTGSKDDLKALQEKIDDVGKPHSVALPTTLRVKGNVSVDRVQQEVKNVMAVLPGTGPMANEYVIVGAHYHHPGPRGGGGTAPSFEKPLGDADKASPLRIKSYGKGGMGPSDHMTFATKRIPVLFFHSGMHADYHRPTDDADKINYVGIKEVVDLAASVIDRLLVLPREQYVEAADAHSMFGGPGPRPPARGQGPGHA